MASSRKSTLPNNSAAKVAATFKRALEAIPARVVVCGDALRPAGNQPGAPARIAVAYSGGLDSSVLLHLAAAHCRDTGIELFAFHVHHGLSPNADSWLAHCHAEAYKLGLRFDARKVALQDVTDHGSEQAARIARYEALAAMCVQHQVRLLLTAHHQDDQAETVLLQLFRGAGLPGLSGMAALHEQHALLGEGACIARPLLACSRAELVQYAQAEAIAFIDDESNADTRYRRNAIRQRIAPAIDEHFPGFAATISRSARHLQAAQRLLDELAAMDFSHCAQGPALAIDRFAAWSADRIDNLLRYWLLSQGSAVSPSEAQLSQLRTQALNTPRDQQPELLLGSLRIERRGNLLLAMPRGGDLSPPSSVMQIDWNGEAEIQVPGWQGTLRFERDVAGGIDPQRLRAGPLQLRPRAGGERLKPDTSRPSRTLKNLFQESAVPPQHRVWLPLLYLGDELVFAAGIGHDARMIRAGEGVRLHWLSALHHVK